MLEIPYFHGPVFDEIGNGRRPLATFRDLVSSGRLFIDNPLKPETFADHMQERIAILGAEGGAAGHPVSHHPEMGDLLVKYMMLEATSRTICRSAARSSCRRRRRPTGGGSSAPFLLVSNAVEMMAADARSSVSASERDGARIAVDRLAALADGVARKGRNCSRLPAVAWNT